MIAGETETILARQSGADHYDNFLFFGKNKDKKKKKEKKELTPEEQEAKKAKRQQFWSDVGQQFQEGGTVSNILGLFGAGGGGTAEPSDYEFGMAEQNQPSPQDAKKIPTGAIIIGGIVILGFAVYGYTQYQKNQQLKLAQVQ